MTQSLFRKVSQFRLQTNIKSTDTLWWNNINTMEWSTGSNLKFITIMEAVVKKSDQHLYFLSEVSFFMRIEK